MSLTERIERGLNLTEGPRSPHLDDDCPICHGPIGAGEIIVEYYAPRHWYVLTHRLGADDPRVNEAGKDRTWCMRALMGSRGASAILALA